MSEIDEAIVGEVVSEIVPKYPGMKKEALENILFKINLVYAKLKKSKVQVIDFEKIIEDSLDLCGFDTLFDIEERKQYKFGIGKYYTKRQAKDAQLLKENEHLIGEASHISDQSVTIRASQKVSITFSARKKTGELRFSDVDTGLDRKVHFGRSKRVPEDLYLNAKRKARAIMNSRRK